MARPGKANSETGRLGPGPVGWIWQPPPYVGHAPGLTGHGLCLTYPPATWYNNRTESGDSSLSSVANRRFSTDGL